MKDGPVERGNGTRVWLKNGETHRDNGPAVEWPSGCVAWYLNGNNLTFADWCKATKQTPQQITLLRLKYIV